MTRIARLAAAIAAAVLLAGCAESPRRHYPDDRPMANVQPVRIPYTGPMPDSPGDLEKIAYAAQNLTPGHRVFWLTPDSDRIVFLGVTSASFPDDGQPKGVMLATQKPDGRTVMVEAKAGRDPDGRWKLISPFEVPLDDNGRKLLDADYREAYRRATTPPPEPEKPAKSKSTAAKPTTQAQAQPQVQAQARALPPDAPAGLYSGDDLDLPSAAAPKPASGQRPHGGRPKGRGGYGGGPTGRGVLGGMGM